ncbi:RraA family protein [Geminicoccaceae bacterium 1502E]|nr:RraA family protein [Geminicoccaceae bacterium 1502E]
MAIDQKLFDHLAAFDTPTICNALEVVAPQRRGFGYSFRPFVCAFPQLKPMVGFARTCTIRSTEPSKRPAAELKKLRLDYYDYVAARPGEPTITILQDLDDEPGFGAFWGEVNTAVHKGLGVLGCITNGSIRDLDAVATDFQLLAGRVGPSHAFVRVEEIDLPVEVHGMKVSPGELIHADRHGSVVIPLDVAEQLPAAIDLCTRKEAPILKAARDAGFNTQKLREAMGAADDIH